MTMRFGVRGALMTISLTLLSSVAVAQLKNTGHTPGSCPLLIESCNAMCVSNRDCSLPHDTRSCGRDIAIPFSGNIHFNDPTCEAAKAAQNAAYSSQMATCESVKAAEHSECEVRKSGCLAVAEACGNVREKAAASKIDGAQVLWVDTHPDKNTYERQALAELKVKVILVSNTEEALSAIQQTPRINATISSLNRPDGPLAGDSLLAAILKLRPAPPYIIYSTSSNAATLAEAKAKGAFGETDRFTELLDLIISAVSKRK